ncbi:NAD-dependent epimerase/dehydratase family protein [Rosenbergiella australiborealis]|uniref:NAD-dependent epimerase/dehydratase family protein n=1 Tax=Rosenbergiella australiborealis TaxID=1544696 RepID=A0ABS5T9S9_9GAMM|nr:NAD-dependent epimerase/dehydratase family protein [Rosenbergiella australiborealis]MBT0728192.1 NAD-dependent epimerase/dehydratase family protein [Rosenbergiella australiborealis]
MTQTVALTGATGFIGSHIVEKLLAAGFQVRALTRSPANLEKKAGLTWVRGSLEDERSLQTLVSGADIVVHCAGQVRGKNSYTFTSANIDGSLRLLNAAEESAHCKRYLFISSLAARHPQLSWYAQSKASAEKALVSKASSVSIGIFRPTAVYGPRDKELRPVFAWLLRGLLPQTGSSSTQLSFLHVYDFAEAVLKWIEADVDNSHPYELCDGQPSGYRWKDLQQIGQRVRQKPVKVLNIPLPLLKTIATLSTQVSRLTGKEPMLTQSKIGELTHIDWSATNDKITQSIGWTPNIPLERALRDGLF